MYKLLLVMWCALASCKESYNNTNTLILTNVVFRHGDRTPDNFLAYPTDPYKNDNYAPVGIGQLTIKGKRRAYKLGTMLRKRYKELLCDGWNSETSESYSSFFTRNKMSLQAVLAGLFPAAADETIDEAGNNPWQPVDYTYFPLKDDFLIAKFVACQSFFTEDRIENDQDPYVQSVLANYSDVFKYMTEKTGTDINFYSAFGLLDHLSTQVEWGHALPEWTQTLYPTVLTELSELYHRISFRKTSWKKLFMGSLLKKITLDSWEKANGTLATSGRKIYIYAVHDFNILGFLAAFNRPDLFRKVPYSAFLLFELHLINGIYGLKVFYHNYETSEPFLLNITNCGKFCPLDRFYNLHKEYFPESNECPTNATESNGLIGIPIKILIVFIVIYAKW